MLLPRLVATNNATARTMLGQTIGAARNDVAQQKTAVATGSGQGSTIQCPCSHGALRDSAPTAPCET
jgi:hypothetical protein